ncbi:hypothetical protein BJD13_07325 [Xanthomonas perforans]|nr:hypothetical protein BJD13_07325 [Xanthomonas perforans]
MNVDKFISANSGEKVIGYKIWYLPESYIEAERHAILRCDGELRDLTFNADGETSILFVPDAQMVGFDARRPKVRVGLTGPARRAAQVFDAQDRRIAKASVEDSWNMMLTYEQWLAGERMGSLLTKLEHR